MILLDACIVGWINLLHCLRETCDSTWPAVIRFCLNFIAYVRLILLFKLKLRRIPWISIIRVLIDRITFHIEGGHGRITLVVVTGFTFIDQMIEVN